MKGMLARVMLWVYGLFLAESMVGYAFHYKTLVGWRTWWSFRGPGEEFYD